MMFRTHIAAGAFLALLFLPAVVHKWSFFVIVMFCTLLPDIDCTQSYLGKYKILRPLQWVVKHRGFFHSFTFAVAVALIFVFYYPILALPFFLGYAGHLIADSLTPEGIRIFWPLKNEVKWRIRTGGKTENILFYVLWLANVGLLIRVFI